MELIYKTLISAELEELELNLSNSISSDIQLATEVSNYIVSSGGKRIRPVICILVARALNYPGSELIRLASSIELLHTATLIHDDIVDHDDDTTHDDNVDCTNDGMMMTIIVMVMEIITVMEMMIGTCHYGDCYWR